jgi:hypothetical protein
MRMGLSRFRLKLLPGYGKIDAGKPDHLRKNITHVTRKFTLVESNRCAIYSQLLVMEDLRRIFGPLKSQANPIVPTEVIVHESKCLSC